MASLRELRKLADYANRVARKERADVIREQRERDELHGSKCACSWCAQFNALIRDELEYRRRARRMDEKHEREQRDERNDV